MGAIPDNRGSDVVGREEIEGDPLTVKANKDDSVGDIMEADGSLGEVVIIVMIDEVTGPGAGSIHRYCSIVLDGKDVTKIKLFGMTNGSGIHGRPRL